MVSLSVGGDGEYNIAGGGGGMYVGGAVGWTTGITPVIPNTLTISTPTQYHLGPPKLSDQQVQQLLAEHRFIPMDEGVFCLFCYALDLWRTAKDHLFVIREE